MLRVEIPAAAQALVGPCHPTHSVGRQGEMENRSVAGLADNADLAPMQFDNRLGNGQPHSSTLYHHALLASAIELLENHLLFQLIDAGSVVGNACDDFRTVTLNSDMNGTVWWGVLRGVVQEMGNHFGDAVDIHLQGRQMGWNVDLNRMAAQSGL